MNQKEIAINKINILTAEMQNCDKKIEAIQAHKKSIQVKIQKIKNHINKLSETEKTSIKSSQSFSSEEEKGLDESYYS